ncbi:MAG: hypothetical protein AAF799_21395 [Myxococcota bacterium]
MRDRLRKRLALGVSFVAHTAIVGAPVFRMSCVPSIEIPEFDDFEFTEVELIDPDAIKGPTPEPEPEPEQPPPEPEPPEEAPPPPPTPEDPNSKEEKPPPEPEPEPEKPKPKKFAAKGSRVSKLAPETSTFHMLLVPRKLRRHPLRQNVLDIMAPLPDFEYLIDQGRFDALKDFDHIVIASPDIRDWTQTFLAVDYKVSREEAQRGIERAAAVRNEVIEWVDDGGFLRGNPRPADPDAIDPDNRWFVFLEDNIAVYVREEFLPNIIEGPTEDGRKTSGNFVANLVNLRRYARRQPKAALQIVIADVRKNVTKNPLPFEIPDEFEISVSSDLNPQVLIRTKFDTVEDARAFQTWWSKDLRETIGSNLGLIINVKPIYEKLEVEREARSIQIRGELTTGQAEMGMKYGAGFSQQIAGKTPEEVEEMRRRRIEAIKARRNGKLPPSALDEPEEDEESKAPPATMEIAPLGAQPPATPANAGSASSPPPSVGPGTRPGTDSTAPKPTKPTADGS